MTSSALSDLARRVARRALVSLAAASLLVVSDRAGAARPRSEHAATAEDLQVVDCLLPGQVRRLGRNQTFLTQRRPVRTTALDCQIRGGEFVAYDRANYGTALEVWRASAEAGDPQAQYYVGEIYEKGLGRDPDYGMAAQWYRKAADQGYAQAQIHLGFLLERGLAGEADPVQALSWYRKASGVTGVILLESDLAAIRKELQDTSARLATAEGSARELEGQLEASRRDLKAARSGSERSSARIAQLEARVGSLTTEVGTRRQDVARLQDAKRRYDVRGPSIEIVDVGAVRGVRADPSGKPDLVIGRVDAPAGLESFLANGRPEPVDADGFFRMEKGASQRIVFVAIDRQGKRAERTYEREGAAAREGKGSAPDLRLGSYRALIIGNDAYTLLPRLETAVRDAEAVAELLRSRYGFRTTLLKNATYFDVLSAFHTLRQELTDKDNLLIYYAGHGEIDAGSGLGYWLPVDAQPDRKIHWMSSEEISEHLSLLPARHVLVIADSCYSGALTRSSLARIEDAPAEDRDRLMRDVAARRSRTALTSGGVKPVLDAGGSGHSVFTGALLQVLSRNTETLATRRLWSAVSVQVEYVTSALGHQQSPEYAPIRFAGHESGEFFFQPTKG